MYGRVRMWFISRQNHSLSTSWTMDAGRWIRVARCRHYIERLLSRWTSPVSLRALAARVAMKVGSRAAGAACGPRRHRHIYSPWTFNPLVIWVQITEPSTPAPLAISLYRPQLDRSQTQISRRTSDTGHSGLECSHHRVSRRRASRYRADVRRHP